MQWLTIDARAVFGCRRTKVHAWYERDYEGLPKIGETDYQLSAKSASANNHQSSITENSLPNSTDVAICCCLERTTSPQLSGKLPLLTTEENRLSFKNIFCKANPFHSIPVPYHCQEKVKSDIDRDVSLQALNAWGLTKSHPNFRTKSRLIDDSLLWDDTIDDSFFQAAQWLNLCANNGIILNPKEICIRGRHRRVFRLWDYTRFSSSKQKHPPRQPFVCGSNYIATQVT